MRIVVFNSFFPPAFLGGGPIRTLAAMLAASPPGYETAVLTTNKDLGRRESLDVVPDKWLPYGGAKVYYCSMTGLLSFWNGLRESRRQTPDVVYLNSFFDPKFSIIPQIMFSFGWFRRAALAIAPRGEFSPGALSIKKTKKSLFIGLFRSSGLHRKVIWHASATAEAADIKKIFGSKVRVIIRENDTLLPDLALKPLESASGPLRAVSLSRLSPKKGVDVLLEGLQSVSEPLELDVIGPPEDDNYHQRCLRLVEKVPPFVRVQFLGALPHEEILFRLNRYDVMLCPTKGENFGHVIAEALSASLPVLCADVTPWTERLAAGGGAVVSPNTPLGWTHAVSDYARKIPADRLKNRLEAETAYNRWRRENTDAHFFSLLEEEVRSLTR